MKTQAMQRSRLAPILAALYRAGYLRGPILRFILRLEGGELTSRTLRDLLRDVHGVAVGEYSYGSLLTPGFADPATTIGRYVSVGPNVRRIGAGHPMRAMSMHPYFYNPALGFDVVDVPRSPCVIESDAWLGANAILLPGCTRVGFGAVIGAGSIVTIDVPDFAVVVGSPAKVVRYRFDESQRKELLEQRPWDLEPHPLFNLIRDWADEGHDTE